VPILVKIDQEMRPWECPQTDRHTDRHTDANRFYNLSHAIFSSAMGQIIKCNKAEQRTLFSQMNAHCSADGNTCKLHSQQLVK